jgi:hypothetical protein
MGASGGAAEKVYVEDVFSTWLYAGNNSTQTITNGIDLAGKGGLVWIKCRSATGGPYTLNHILSDTARGTRKALYTNATDAQSASTNFGVSAYNSDGFSLNGSFVVDNSSVGTYTSWTFRKAAKFFDVVTYTGTGSARTIAHNLGSVPGCIIVKSTSQADNWKVYHRSLTSNAYYILLDSTAAQSNAVDLWNSTTPTSTEFSIGSSSNINTNGATYVAYLFAHNAGGFGDSGSDSVVSCGGFTSDSSGNATVTLGWEPQWLLFKRTDSTGSWALHDTMRGGSLSASSNGLSANTSEAEGAGTSNYAWNPTATGFQFRASLGGSGATYVYMAIRRGPMKTPTDATKVFDVDAQAGGSFVTTSFSVDLSLLKRRTNVETTYALSRLQGGTQYLETASTNAEQTAGASPVIRFDSNVGVEDDFFGSGSSLVYFNFRRAPGFFDVVAYTGTDANRMVSHNLGVAPELMIVKQRSGTAPWAVYCSALGNGQFLEMDFSAASTSSALWNNTTPTSSVFTVGTNGRVNVSPQTYVAYLFASLTGISKVGSYTGTGTTLSVDCGFTNGARFVLIKRTDSTGDWYVWDTARGIVSGNDPYLLLNSTAAEVTNTDFIDPLSSGFQISSTAPAAINANGGTFIYLAIA